MRNRPWLRAALMVVAILLSASWGLSLALHGGWARRSLLARLSASFGRPVEAGYFEFSLWNGPRLEAHSVTVTEDPRFGAEYFLRADELTASPRWSELLRGRLEFGTLCLTRASLNLVRGADGHWNIESWLPPSKAAASTIAPSASDQRSPDPSVATRVALRLAHIEIDSGRINFKRGVEKLPFALLDVSGRLDQDGAGRWSIDLEAHPARASVALQESGTLRLRGTVAGTSARLRPASLALSWEQASFADVIRLLRGGDYGVRGTLAAEFSASVDDSAAAPPDWKIAGVLRMTDMHRWDLAGRTSDPAVNVNVTAAWHPGEERLQLLDCVVEAPHSRLRAVGELSWLRGFSPHLEVSASQLGFEDLLDWRRAFLPGVADGFAADGAVSVDATLDGWPVRVEEMTLDSPGATVREDAVSAPIRLGRIQVAWGGAAGPARERGVLVLKSLEVRLPGATTVATSRSRGAPVPAIPAAPSAGVLRVAGSLGPFEPGESPGRWPYQLTVSGETTRAQDLFRLAGLGRPNAEWSVEGAAALQLAWSGYLGRGRPAASGTIKLHGLQINSVLMSAPVMVSAATIDLRPGGRRVKIDDVEAFGARWRGSLEWQESQRAWTFDLSADRLDSAGLEQWLGSREQSFLERVLPFGGPSEFAPAREAALAHLAARGRLRVAEVAVGPLRIAGLDADAQLDGRNILLLNAQGDFYGGRVAGEFQARLTAVPSYVFRGQLNRTNLAELVAAAPPLAGRLAGLASGPLTLAARGIAAKDLMDSLEGDASLRIRDAILRSHAATPGDEVFSDSQGQSEEYSGAATATLHVARGRVRVDQLLFTGRDGQFELAGNVDFARHLDLLIQSGAGADDVAESDFPSGRKSWSVSGTIDAPLVSRPTRTARDRVAAPAARRLTER